jgi:hypothetical protein
LPPLVLRWSYSYSLAVRFLAMRWFVEEERLLEQVW